MITPEASPDLAKRSWFGALMGSVDRDECHFVMVRDKPLNAIKADLVHAFLSVGTLSNNEFIEEPNSQGAVRIKPHQSQLNIWLLTGRWTDGRINREGDR